MADITFQAVNAGVDGNLIFINLVQEVSAATIVQSVTTTNFNQATINIRVGFTAGFGALNVGTWADVATFLNSVSAIAALVSVTGDAGYAGVTNGVGQLAGGTQGLTPGVYYFAAPGLAPAMPPKIQVLEPIVLPEYFCVTHRRCGRRVQGSKQVYVYRK